MGVEVIDAARAYKVDVAYRPESKSAKHITIQAKKEVERRDPVGHWPLLEWRRARSASGRTIWG